MSMCSLLFFKVKYNGKLNKEEVSKVDINLNQIYSLWGQLHLSFQKILLTYKLIA